MTSQEMVTAVRNRTHMKDDTRVLQELNAAQSWAFNRLYTSENGRELLVSFAQEIEVTETLRDYAIADDLNFAAVGFKQLWLKFASETTFTPMVPVDSTDVRFVSGDVGDSDSTVVATGHPVYYQVRGFNAVRFSPPVPSGCTLRVDYYRYPGEIDPTVNNTLDTENDLPAFVHEAIVEYATAEIWDQMDDDRAMARRFSARELLTAAIYAVGRRTQGPTVTTPYRGGRSRRFI
jgi:hypothetical protein